MGTPATLLGVEYKPRHHPTKAMSAAPTTHNGQLTMAQLHNLTTDL